MRPCRLLLPFVLAACSSSLPPVGQPCAMTKPGPDGGLVPITEGELAGLAGYSEFFSFGGPDCKTGVCYLDAGAPPANPSAAAIGYCTVACQPKQACDSVDSARPMSCQPMALSAQLIGAACDGGCPGTQTKAGAYFCIR
jgi:hypothetical protein